MMANKLELLFSSYPIETPRDKIIYDDALLVMEHFHQALFFVIILLTADIDSEYH